jgi:NAD(P)-dependent dehydrogenase (short-subunit alcohol dehydrogenase family)
MGPRVQGKSALLTGAASGIGLATAVTFCRDGASIILADARAKQTEEAATRLCTRTMLRSWTSRCSGNSRPGSASRSATLAR